MKLLHTALLVSLFPTLAFAQAGSVIGQQKISEAEGGFTGSLTDADLFGSSVGALGDLNNDGREDVLVGAPNDPTNGGGPGRVWIQFLNTDGTVAGGQEIGLGLGGFNGLLDTTDAFGASVAGIGDLNGDGTEDAVVGAPRDDDGGQDRGAIWILFLNPDGTVWANWKISDLSGGFTGALDDGDVFGSSVTNLGDMDGDGHADIAVGAPGDDDGGGDRGAIWILFLNANGTVKAHQKISVTSGGFSGYTTVGYRLGQSLARLDDLDGDGAIDLAVGHNDNARGGVYLLFLNHDGTVRSQKNIAISEPGNVLPLENGFGSGLTSVGDIDGDGVDDLAVGTTQPGSGIGMVWVLFLEPDGNVRTYQVIGSGAGGFAGTLHQYDEFGSSLASLEDLNGDKVHDIAIGSRRDDDGGLDHGAIWVTLLDCSSATAIDRNGSGVNPGILYSTNLPNIGTSWNVDLNCIGHAPASSMLMLRGRPMSGPVIGFGEVLVGGLRIYSAMLPHLGGIQHFSLSIPNDNALCGLRIYSQGICFGNPAPQLSNAVDIVVGH